MRRKAVFFLLLCASSMSQCVQSLWEKIYKGAKYKPIQRSRSRLSLYLHKLVNEDIADGDTAFYTSRALHEL